MNDKTARANEEDMELIWKIYEFGGYATFPAINCYRNKRDPSTNKRCIYRLVDCGYLRPIPFYSDSDRDVMVFRVTAKTCRQMGNPNSYLRKPHDPTYIIRALMKQHFLFELCNGFYPYMIASNEKRIELLTRELGIDAEFLPKKYNAESSFVHIEEYILDVRNCREIPSNSCITLEDAAQKILFIYIDKYQSNPSAQLLSLINRYKGIIAGAEKIKMGFILVTDSEARERQYLKAVERHLCIDTAAYANCPIPEDVINLHSKVLIENFNYTSNRVSQMTDEIKNVYRKSVPITESDYEGIAVDDIKKSGINGLKRCVEDVISSGKSKAEIRNMIHMLFAKVYKLHAAGVLSSIKEYNVQIYRIGRKYSL